MVGVMHFLLVFDRLHGRLLSVRAFDDHRQALVERFRAEREHRTDADIEVVVLTASSQDALRRTHARYFESVSTLATGSAATGGAPVVTSGSHTAARSASA